MRNQLRFSILTVLLSLCLAVFAQLCHAQGASIQRGEQIFNAKCTPCHTIGGGRKVGPDLKGVAKEQPQTWLFSFISDPEKMFAANDPHAVMLLNEYKVKMPNMGLSPDDVNAVIGYFAVQGGEVSRAEAVPAAPTPATTPSTAGVAEKGEGYFTGRLALQKGGPPCMACHSAARIKYLGGGNLGPDLTTAYQALGEGIVSMLVNVPFPIMKPIFDSHPLTTQEAQDLAAFLQVAASQQRENPTTRVIVVSVAAFVILMIIGLIIWRGRLVSVRKAMVDRSVREDGNR